MVSLSDHTPPLLLYSLLLQDLHTNLQRLGSRLFIIQGKTQDVLPFILKEWNITKLVYEKDIEPYSRVRDQQVQQLCRTLSIECTVSCIWKT